MKLVVSNISDIFIGAQKAYIYIWMSRSHRFFYVGQTNDKMGTFGRAISHLSASGTLRQRCEERVGVPIEYVNDLVLYTFDLPSTPEFIGCETSFRIAVEYLVQSKLYRIRQEIGMIFQLISNVSTTDRVSSTSAKDLSDEIIEHFKKSIII
jgi:hypothetical protein